MHWLRTREENQLTFLDPARSAHHNGAVARVLILALPTSKLRAGSSNTVCLKVPGKLHTEPHYNWAKHSHFIFLPLRIYSIPDIIYYFRRD